MTGLSLQFPYVTPAPHEPVKTLRSLVNIRKDSLRLVRYFGRRCWCALGTWRWGWAEVYVPQESAEGGRAQVPALRLASVVPSCQAGASCVCCLLRLTFVPFPLGRYKEDADSPAEESGKRKALYSLEFTFDADARVAITIYCQATEEIVGGMAV